MNTVKPGTYVACLCTDNYLSGVLVLYESLRKTNPKYPFLCLVSSNVSDATIGELKKRNIAYKVKELVDVSELVGSPMNGWDYTYFKFRIFELEEYEKVVYLDSDMIVMNNIDELFDEEPIAACSDGYQFTGKKDNADCGCNSGLLVIKPDKTLFEKLIAKIPAYIKSGRSGDQGILSKFLEGDRWLPEIYNMTPNMVDKACYRTKYYDFKYKDVKVFHFIWRFKPFMTNQLSFKNTVGLLARGHFHEIMVLRKYYGIMKELGLRIGQ